MMENTYELATRLLQVTESLHQSAEAENWDALPQLQQQRVQLIHALENSSEPDMTQETLTAIRQLLIQSQLIERQALVIITQQQEKISHEHNQLQQNQKARKAYGSFS
ncbi:MAG: flagellar protein FliT [Oceanospirillales bacterium]|uniref:Flagellar protein FliT n=1 Tax=Marinobacterium halophilum TaxID=267374 RepID=A0A2P8ESB7_9GAMM|nr:flagellar protein FliT [Marinobacterium halophilum]MBR9827677.1 flagellar protein FliT [Oceanospirillales bacterium]PSL12342.1 protein FliT [Marinobacterium halophilum]